jgi:anti-anti-sigma regulatory factor
MDIRIDIETEGAEVVLRVAGRLAGDAITQLTNVCEPMEDNTVLDLSKLMFVDEAGAEAIQYLREKGANIRGASTFIKLLLNREPS